MKAPFPWFGGKSRVAHLVWPRFGDVPNYVEPFAGSLAVLLNRPHAPQTETVNDKDAYLSNFWRALQLAPDEVTRFADWPVNEVDLHARHEWLLQQSDFRERMEHEPDYYDAKIAGWWVWGLCQWIGSGWCKERLYQRNHNQRPHLGNDGMVIHRPSKQLPYLGSAGQGIQRASLQMPQLSGGSTDKLGTRHTKAGDELLNYMHALSARLRKARVCCGDWTRILGPSVTYRHGVTAVFLDPPYSHDERDGRLYGIDENVACAVREWALENGDNPQLHIALCGYDSEHDMPAEWRRVAWKAPGGYGSQGNDTGRSNSNRETIWFSPHCLGAAQMGLQWEVTP